MSRSIDVAVVGGGPAGVAAALAAAESGRRVILIDENERPGGPLRWSVSEVDLPGDLAGKRGYEFSAWAEAELDARGVEVATESAAWGMFEGGVLTVAGSGASYQLNCGSIVIASGATDITLPFPGWELPGVMTATAFQKLVNLHRVTPGQRLALIGNGAEAADVALTCSLAGIELAARAESTTGVRLSGSARVEAIEHTGTLTPVDAVVIALGRQPDPELALQALCEIEYSPLSGAHVPTRTTTLETSIPGVYVAGDAGGLCTAGEAFAEGRLAGLAAAGQSYLSAALNALAATRTQARATVLAALAAFEDEVQVCRCEEITAGAIRAAIDEGALSINDVKRRTRAGMGLCQGIFCTRTIATMIEQRAGVPLTELVPMTARPPTRVISLASLAELAE